MKHIEHLALAIIRTCGGFTPDSEAFQLNNPGLLRAFSVNHRPDSYKGYRRFLSWQGGFKALIFDLTLKCGGKSNASVEKVSQLKDLLALWEIKETRKTLNFLRRSCNDQSISDSTSLEYFVCP